MPAVGLAVQPARRHAGATQGVHDPAQAEGGGLDQGAVQLLGAGVQGESDERAAERTDITRPVSRPVITPTPPPPAESATPATPPATPPELAPAAEGVDDTCGTKGSFVGKTPKETSCPSLDAAGRTSVFASSPACGALLVAPATFGIAIVYVGP